MSTSQPILVYLLKDLARKLNPERFPGIPPTLAALTGFILGAEFCTPYITAVVISDKGTVLARINGDTSRVLGSYSAVLRNWMATHLPCWLNFR
jgi:hypothetical protein